MFGRLLAKNVSHGKLSVVEFQVTLNSSSYFPGWFKAFTVNMYHSAPFLYCDKYNVMFPSSKGLQVGLQVGLQGNVKSDPELKARPVTGRARGNRDLTDRCVRPGKQMESDHWCFLVSLETQPFSSVLQVGTDCCMGAEYQALKMD